MKKYLLIFLLCAAATGCARRGTFVPGAVVYQPRYAAGFTIYEAGGLSSVIRVKDPWQGAEDVEQWVFVSRGGERPPENFAGMVVEASPERIVCMSSSYVAFLEQLDEGGRIAAVSGLDFITSPDIRERGAAGDVADVGFETNLNFELIASLRPQLILMYGVSDEGRQVTGKYREMGVPYMFVAEYLESLPLGKAEWIVALAEILGVRQRGIAEFRQIEEAYNKLNTLASGFTERPVVMLNAPYRDTWYVPGDDNYMVRLIRDAGGRYACAGTDSHDSRPIDVEQAYVAMQSADFWLNTNHYTTLAGLLGDNPRFAGTHPVRDGRVYNNNARTTSGGGSDFWESGVVRPDQVLRDLVKILHPDALPADSVLYYYRRLE